MVPWSPKIFLFSKSGPRNPCSRMSVTVFLHEWVPGKDNQPTSSGENMLMAGKFKEQLCRILFHDYK